MFLYNSAVNKARSLKQGDMVSWNSSGGRAEGKVIRVVDSGTIDIPDSSFKIKGEKDNPAVLIQLYRDGKPTDRQVGHKMSALRKSIEFDFFKHASHNQSTHGKGGGGASSNNSFTATKISAKDIKVGDKLDIQGKTRVHAVKMIGDKIAVGLKTRGSRGGGFKSWDPEENITVFRKAVGFELFKHGSHNQKTHAGSRGGGTGFDSTGRGGGVDSTGRKFDTQRNNELTAETEEKVSDLQTTLNSFNDEDSDNFVERFSDDDDAIIDSALDDLAEAEEQLGFAQDANTTNEHLDKINNALVRLDDAYDSLVNADNRSVKRVAQDLDVVSGKLEDFYAEFLGR